MSTEQKHGTEIELADEYIIQDMERHWIAGDVKQGPRIPEADIRFLLLKLDLTRIGLTYSKRQLVELANEIERLRGENNRLKRIADNYQELGR